MSTTSQLLPFQPMTMTTAQLAAVSFLARYAGHTHELYSFQLRRWFEWCDSNGLDPLVGIQRAPYRALHPRPGRGRADGVLDQHDDARVRGFFRFAHIDGLIPADPAVYARLPKVHSDESRTQGLDRLDLIRFLEVSQTITVHHGALAYRLGINALRASEAAAVRIEDYAETLRGHRVLHLVGKGDKPATMPLTVPVLRVLEACRSERTSGPLILRPMSGKPIDRRDVHRMVRRIAKAAGIPRHISPHSLRHAAITNALDAGVPLRDAQILARHADPRTTEHYDRARGNLDRHRVHFLTAYSPASSRLRGRCVNSVGASTPAPLCCQVRGLVGFECAVALVAVKIVRPAGRSILTAPVRLRDGLAAEAATGFAPDRVRGTVVFAGPGSG
jgi:integrase/recombinase XerD